MIIMRVAIYPITVFRLHNFATFFFNDTPTTEIYTLSLHDALPICPHHASFPAGRRRCAPAPRRRPGDRRRSEEHTSELQSLRHLVCRLLLEKKKKLHFLPWAVPRPR